jgi:branched-chain amino acid transport system ATP-binding protein
MAERVDPLLRASALTVRFGGLVALREVTLDVGAGELVGVIGPNGAGKTTLFNVLSGVIRPTAGRLRLAGEDLTGRPAHVFARRGIGRTFQTPRVFGRLTVLENARFGARFAAGRRLDGESPDAAARALLARVGLLGDSDRLAAELPPARQRLLEIAMALSTRPRVLLLDEVAAGLTDAEVDEVAALVRRLRDGLGVAVVWIEHAVGAVLRTMERVAVLDHGVLLADATPVAVSRDPRVLSAYLGAEATP